MAMQITRDQVQRTLGQAKKLLVEHKHTVSELTKGIEAFGAPMLAGIIQGRLAKDGSGRVAIAGVPVNLLLGVIGIGAGASGYLDEYGVHASNMASGLLGAYGADLGRDLGLKMRSKAGLPVAPGAIVGNEYTGEFNTLVGAAPAPLSAAQLEQMVKEASVATY